VPNAGPLRGEARIAQLYGISGGLTTLCCLLVLSIRRPEQPTRRTALTDASDLALLLGRIAMAAVFIPSGFAKLSNVGAFAAALEKRGVPFADILSTLGGLIEFLGGIAVALGIHARWAAALMIVFTLAATAISHRFWELEGTARQAQEVQFFKNLAIVGGFLFLVVNGGGRYCLDRLWQRAARQPRRRSTDSRSTAHPQTPT
jgi:putative oxidoreductase